MPTSDTHNKDHDLLIRIEERLTLLIERVVSLETTLQSSKDIAEDCKTKINKIETDLYGNKNVDGIIQKVEKHDKILVKMLAYCSIFVVVIEFLIKHFYK